MRRKWILLTGVMAAIAVVAALLIYVFVYNKPHRDFAKAEPDFTIGAAELLEEFRNDAGSAGARYNGKILAVRGSLSSVETDQEQTIAVFALEEGLFGDEGIRMVMLPEQAEKVARNAPGTELTIKGFCSGYNETDVILEHCSVLESNTTL